MKFFIPNLWIHITLVGILLKNTKLQAKPLAEKIVKLPRRKNLFPGEKKQFR